MNLTRRRQRITQQAVSGRRGTIIAWTAMAVVFGGLCLALVVNTLWVTGVRADSRRCAEAAALAAGQALLTDDLLRQQTYPVENQWRLERSRNTALEIAAQYRRLHRVAPLPPEAVEFLGEESSNALPQAVRVSFAATPETARIPLFLTGLTGLRSAVNGISSLVELQNTPVGFRPASHVPVPMLPLALLDEDEAGGDLWRRQIEQYEGADRFAWDREHHEIERGPDGIPEITVLTDWGSRDNEVKLHLLRFGADCTAAQIERRFVEGLSAADLQQLERAAIEFPGPVRLDFETECDSRPVFQRVIGLPRIVCLAGRAAADSGTSAAAADGELQLLRPVAARVMHVQAFSDTRLAITLQPCVLSTVTAVHDSAAERSRYVYSLRLRY